MKYQRVWLSTVEHISEFSKLIKNDKKSVDLSKSYELPQGFPYIKTISKKSPVALLAKGELQILDTGIIFQSRKYWIENLRIYNLNEDLRIELDCSGLSISRFKNPNPYKKSATINWIKIDCTEKINGFGNHILICRVPFYSSIYNIQNSTDSLFQNLAKRIEYC